ncbi:phytoene desaturase [bacterium]|nr:MAG: phytoene desaturase [bacterium]
MCATYDDGVGWSRCRRYQPISHPPTPTRTPEPRSQVPLGPCAEPARRAGSSLRRVARLVGCSAVVIGAGQGGLSAAIHLRLKGYDVRVLERHDHCGGKAAALEVEGFRLDPGPSIIILADIYRRVFEAAGRRMEDYLEFRRLDPITRVFFGKDGPIDLPAGFEACRERLRDFAPGDVPGFEELFRKLESVAPFVEKTVFDHPIEKGWQLADPRFLAIGMRFDVRKSYRELVDGWFTSPLMRSFFYGFPSYSGNSYESKAAGALLIPYYMLAQGVWWPEGGVGAIPAAFERLARELGVEILMGRDVVGYEHKEGRLRSVTDSTGERHEAEAFVANVDRSTIRRAIFGDPLPRPSFSYFTLHWGLDHRLENTEHHTLIVPEDFEKGFTELYDQRTFPTKPIVYLNDTTTTDPGTAPVGSTNLFAVVTAPGDEPSVGYRERSVEYGERVRRACGSVGIEIGTPVFERLQNPPYFAEAHGNAGGSLYGPDEPLRAFGGLLPLPPRDPDLKNLVYCGGSVQPGAGLPMVTLSGKFAAMALP